MATIHKRAEQRERVHGLLDKFGKVIDIVATVRSDRRVGQQVRGVLTQTQEIGAMQQECATPKIGAATTTCRRCGALQE